MKILHLISSPRGEASQSILLGNAIIRKLVSKYEQTSVKERNLTLDITPYLDADHISSFNTPIESRSSEQLDAIQHSDILIEELMDADVIVVGAPMYNFGIPAVLKSWIDHIARTGVAFTYTSNGPAGLIQGKKVFLAIATGGVYSEGDFRAIDFIEPYLRTSLGFFGLTDITTFRVEGLVVSALKDKAMEVALEKLNTLD